MNTERNRLERQFADHVQELIRRSITECKYHPTDFIQMVKRHTVVEACRRVIMDHPVTRPPSGFMRMCEEGHLDLTVETAVLQSPWCKLFDDDVLLRARRRLVAFEYRGDMSCECLDAPAKS
jgi:hypothetical protein